MITGERNTSSIMCRTQNKYRMNKGFLNHKFTETDKPMCSLGIARRKFIDVILECMYCGPVYQLPIFQKTLVMEVAVCRTSDLNGCLCPSDKIRRFGQG